MERLVYGVFKAIFLSMIFVIIWQLGFYLYNVSVLDQRMSNLLVSMEKTVSENNYMPSEEAALYQSILTQLQNQFDGRFSDGTQHTDKDGNVRNDGFIANWTWNYNDGTAHYHAFTPPASSGWVNTSGNAYDLSLPNSYGSVACINVTFVLRAPWIGFGHANEMVRTNGVNGNTAEQWHVETTETSLAYTSYVPCLKYRKITY